MKPEPPVTRTLVAEGICVLNQTRIDHDSRNDREACVGRSTPFCGTKHAAHVYPVAEKLHELHCRSSLRLSHAASKFWLRASNARGMNATLSRKTREHRPTPRHRATSLLRLGHSLSCRA